MKQIRGIIFDVDGTLIDSNDFHAKSWREILTEEGFEISYHDIRKLIGMGGDKILYLLTGLDSKSGEGKRISDLRAELFRNRYLHHLRPFPKSKELVEKFKNDGYTLAVATSSKAEELDGLLKVVGIQNSIPIQVTLDDVGASKPEADPLIVALEKMKLGQDEVLMIGDTPYDLEAANRAGIACIAFECGGWSQEELEDAAEVYRDPEDLLNSLDRSIFFLKRAA